VISFSTVQPILNHLIVMMKDSGILMARFMFQNDSQLKQDLIAEHHDTLYSGHFGEAKTLENLQKVFYWPGMS
jgi:hypothetical protein